MINSNLSQKMKISILGASGIGKFHARNFAKLNVEIKSILCSSEFSGKKTSKALKDSFGLEVDYFDDLEILLNKSSPDAVVISTPNKFHYEQIIKVLDKKIPIFCEKPLFWDKKDNHKTFLKKLKLLADHPNRAIFVNTSSASYIESMKNELPIKEDIYQFNLDFITNGNNKYLEIAEDLLPHGLAMIIELLGCHEITSFKQEYSRTKYKCSFSYLGRLINFNFKEGQSYKKKFIFSVNDKKFERIQEGDLNNYQIFLKDVSKKRKIKIEDPFEVYATRFLSFCKKNSNNHKEGFQESSHNLNLMAKILIK